MSANDELAHSPAAVGSPTDRWDRVWNHREQLLRVARRRSMSVEDAEDAVHEAMVRAAERANVDDGRLGAWLTSVTVRLCVDRFRQVGREAEVHTRSVLATPGQATVEEAVCDRAEAEWLAARSTDLPTRQEEVLGLRAQGFDLTQIAQRTGLSYQAVQSLLARARRTLRAVLVGTLANAIWAWRGRPRMAGGQAAALVSAAATLAMAGLALTSPSEAEADETPAPRTRPHETSLPADPRRASRGRMTPELHQPSLSGLPATGYGLRLPTDRDSGAPLTAAGPELPHPPSAPPAQQGADLPALPALPDAPAPAVPTVPDVAALVAPVRAIAPNEPVESVSTITTDSVLAETTAGPFTTSTPLLPQR